MVISEEEHWVRAVLETRPFIARQKGTTAGKKEKAGLLSWRRQGMILMLLPWQPNAHDPADRWDPRKARTM